MRGDNFLKIIKSVVIKFQLYSYLHHSCIETIPLGPWTEVKSENTVSGRSSKSKDVNGGKDSRGARL